jgi:pimeloyl-ACP methyl ester carboxylesterase
MDVSTDYFAGYHGDRLALHTAGPQDGRPLVLMHGLFSTAHINWVKFGHAERLVQAGFRLFMPDLRAHGLSSAPHDPASYPEDVLVKDLLILIDHLGLSAYDLGGFSLGSRTAVRGVLQGLQPRRLMLGGMGLEGLSGWLGRSRFFIDVIDRFGTIKHGDPAYLAQQFMKAQKVDHIAARLLLGSVDDTPASALAAITQKVLVVCGDVDQDNGSAPALAEALPDARYVEVPSTHMGSVTQKEMGEAMVAFLIGE